MSKLNADMTEAGAVFTGELIFLTPLLANACKFLKDQRESEQAWGEFREGSGGLHYACVAVSALCAMYPPCAEEAQDLNNGIARVELNATARFRDSYDSLDLNDLVNLLEILSAQQPHDAAEISKIGTYLEQSLIAALRSPHSLRVREFARGLTGISRIGKKKSQVLKSGLQQLLKMEKEGDGGWPGGMSGDASVVATAVVVEALRAIDPIGSADSIRRGERFLQNSVANGGWLRIGMGDDTFAQATVLRVLAHPAAHASSAETIEAGIAALKASANNDGWGGGPQQPTSVEATATVLLAFAASGENRFVPYRAAHVLLAEAVKSKSTIEKELKNLQQNFDRRLTKESGAIRADRDKWRSEANEQRDQVEKLKEQVQNMERETLNRSREFRLLLGELSRTRTFPYLGGRILRDARTQMVTILSTLLLALAVAIFLLAIFIWHPPAIIRVMSIENIGFLAFTLPVVILAIQLVLQIRQVRNLPSGEQLDSALESNELPIDHWQEVETRFGASALGPVSSVVSRYADVTFGLPPVVREELNYALTRRLVDMPKDIGIDYAQGIVRRLGVPKPFVDQILSWVTLFLDLDSFARRAVTEQIRRQIEPT